MVLSLNNTFSLFYSAVVLFVVSKIETNIVDHREIEFNLWERSGFLK